MGLTDFPHRLKFPGFLYAYDSGVCDLILTAGGFNERVRCVVIPTTSVTMAFTLVAIRGERGGLIRSFALNKHDSFSSTKHFTPLTHRVCALIHQRLMIGALVAVNSKEWLYKAKQHGAWGVMGMVAHRLSDPSTPSIRHSALQDGRCDRSYFRTAIISRTGEEP